MPGEIPTYSLPPKACKSCPECGELLAAPELTSHLLGRHGFLQFDSVLLPPAEARRRLWQRALLDGDAAAHEQLVRLTADAEQTGGPPYAEVLEHELRGHLATVLANPQEYLPRLVRCLRENVAARPQLRRLLRSEDAQVRAVGRELMLPDALDSLREGQATVERIRQWLDRLCPLDGVETKLLVCDRLRQLGVGDEIHTCADELSNERTVPCPECDSTVTRSSLDAHLRKVHRIFQFEGRRYPRAELVPVLLNRVCCPEPDLAVWRTLRDLEVEEYGANARGLLAIGLTRTLSELPDAERGEAIVALARTLPDGDLDATALEQLAGASDPTGRRLALALASRRPPPLPPDLLDVLRPLLMDDRLPVAELLSAAAALVRSAVPSADRVKEVLGALTAGVERTEAIDRLERLEGLVGAEPSLVAFRGQLEERLRMRCPRCAVELRRQEMSQHLWKEHRLLLDGRRVREPWAALEDWVRQVRHGRPELLPRCREVARLVDGEPGLLRLHRLCLQYGLNDPVALRALLAEAELEGATLCPRCYAIVPTTAEVAPAEISANRGRLSARGYRVEVLDRGIFPQVELVTPRWQDRQMVPGRWLTYRGGELLLVGPLVLAALAANLFFPALGLPPLQAVLAFLVAALLTYLAVRVMTRPERDPTSRAVDLAWQQLAPRLHAGGFDAEDSAFLAGLARLSCQTGDPEARRSGVAAARNLAEQALYRGAARHLGALRRLEILDATRDGSDPVPLLVAEMGRCFEGDLPLSFAEGLLAEWDGNLWEPALRARLRLRLLNRAFEAGLEMRNLVDIAAASPSLGRLLGADQVRNLAWLRLVWSQRAQRPWDRCGEAVTGFDLAEDPERGPLLRDCPDLLLLAEFPEPSANDIPPLPRCTVILCGRGVVFQEQVFGSLPGSFEIRQPVSPSPYHALVIDDKRFPFLQSPEVLAGRLEKWFRYRFHDLAGQVDAVYAWKSPGVAATLRERNASPCPDCGTALLPRVGERAVCLEVEAAPE